MECDYRTAANHCTHIFGAVAIIDICSFLICFGRWSPKNSSLMMMLVAVMVLVAMMMLAAAF